jgi:hypothetical protein
VQRDELERRRRERSVGANPIAGDQREPDAEQQVDQRNDRNGTLGLTVTWASPPGDR